MTRSRRLPASWLSFPSRASWVRQARRRSPSVSSARPSKPTSVIRLQDLVGPQASSTSSAVCPCALHTSRSTPRTSSVLPLICRGPPVRLTHASLSLPTVGPGLRPGDHRLRVLLSSTTVRSGENRGPRRRQCSAFQRAAHGAELDLGLGELVGGI